MAAHWVFNPKAYGDVSGPAGTSCFVIVLSPKGQLEVVDYQIEVLEKLMATWDLSQFQAGKS